ncbi:MAG: ABC transporter ATP-binding protein [Terriglobales bacterium]
MRGIVAEAARFRDNHQQMNEQGQRDGCVLRAQNLGRSVGDVVLVGDVSFALRQAEILAVVGPSGSGKSSLLRLINRLDEPTQGTAFVEGVDYRGISPRELRRKVGMVTQRAFLFPGTVADNVRFGPQQRGEVLEDAAVDKLLRDVGLPGYGARDVANLSGGEAQRVSLARALANDPVVLLLDEPTSALDESLKMTVERLILEVVRQSQLTCVIVTHDTQQAKRFAERVVVLDHGSVTKTGSVREVLGA